MMAAAHLRHQYPANNDYQQAELHHQSRAIIGLRSSLSGNIREGEADAILACNLLLYNQAWSSLDQSSNLSTLDVALDLEMDFFFTLATGTMRILRHGNIPHFVRSSSIFGEEAARGPKALLQCAQLTIYPQELEQTFRHEFAHSSSNANKEHLETFMKECRRLIPVISVIKLRNYGCSTPPLETAIVRYLFCWPMLVSDAFISLIKQRDSLARLVLFYFYITVATGLSGKYWWAQRRAEHMAKSIRHTLREKGITPVDLFSDTILASSQPNLGFN
jgi:hypothetical protein